MGVVYLALAQGPAGFQKLKVVKRLRTDLAADPKALEMFLDEARLAARLHHPNIVQTNEVGFDGKHYFLEMEYLEGQSYDALVRQAPRSSGIPLEVSCWILAQVLAGLHHAHELVDLDGTRLQVVHRDVSPHNVMVTYEGSVKLLDFGIAKAADSQSETQTGVVKGKITYMAPEQATRKAVDRRADVFAVGVMLWQALAGARMWGDANDFEIFVKLQAGEKIPSPKSVNPEASDALEVIAMRALALDPKDRYASAAEMQAELEEWLAGREGGSARTVMRLMEELFAAQREAVRQEIESQMKQAPMGRSAVDVPVLGEGEGTRSGTGAGNAEVALTGATKVRQRIEIKGLRAIAIGAIGVALVASIAAVIGARSRRQTSAGPAASASANPSGCTTNVGCTQKNGGKPSICNHTSGACAVLETDACRVLAEPGDVENDKTIWIGAMFPLTGPKADIAGLPSMRAVDLARRDFAQISHGIPRPSASTASRPLAVVMCDDANSAEAPSRHLVGDLGVPAVIGFSTSQEVIDLATAVFVPRHVMAIPTMNMSPLITAIPHPPGEPRLIFRTALSSAQVVVPLGMLLSEVLEPRIRASGVLSRDERVRVAFVRPKNTAGLGFADAVFQHLRFNGKGVIDNGADFQELSLPEPGLEPPKAAYGDVIEAILKMRPHVILYVGEDELTRALFEPLEARWPATVRPYYLSANSLGGREFFVWLGKKGDLRRRFFDVAAPSNTPANVRFTTRYNESYSEKVTPATSPAAPYDAVYMLAYALAATDDVPTGTSLARAGRRLVPPGQPIEVGPSRIYEAFAVLQKGGNLDIEGAGNPMDFDVSTGESLADYVLECVGVDASGNAATILESGLKFSAGTKNLSGTLKCP